MLETTVFAAGYTEALLRTQNQGEIKDFRGSGENYPFHNKCFRYACVRGLQMSGFREELGEYDFREGLSHFITYAKGTLGERGLSMLAQVDWRLPRRLRGRFSDGEWERLVGRAANESVGCLLLEVRLISRTVDRVVFSVGFLGEGVSFGIEVVRGIVVDSPIGEMRDPELPGIDVSLGIKNNGSLKSFLEACLIFRDAAPRKAKELEALFSRGDLEGYRIQIHGLKSTLKVIGAADLGEQAYVLEQAARVGDKKGIGEGHGGFLDGLEALVGMLSGISAGAQESPPQWQGGGGHKEIWREIGDAASSMDTERLQELMLGLEECRLDDSEKALAGDLRRLLQDFDYDGILEALDLRAGSYARST